MPDPINPAISPLILAGGKSNRMRFPKHLLKLPDGTPLYKHQINLLRQVCPESPAVYISLAKDSSLDDFLQEASANTAEGGVTIIYDLESNNTSESAGPAQGLLSAFKFNPTTTWLVVAVDYPLLTTDTLQQLREAYEPPVTCFRNTEGFCEPLVGTWSPEALRRLADNVSNGRSGPFAVVQELGGKQVELPLEHPIRLNNVNTRQDWESVLTLWK